VLKIATSSAEHVECNTVAIHLERKFYRTSAEAAAGFAPYTVKLAQGNVWNAAVTGRSVLESCAQAKLVRAYAEFGADIGVVCAIIKERELIAAGGCALTIAGQIEPRELQGCIRSHAECVPRRETITTLHPPRESARQFVAPRGNSVYPPAK